MTEAKAKTTAPETKPVLSFFDLWEKNKPRVVELTLNFKGDEFKIYYKRNSYTSSKERAKLNLKNEESILDSLPAFVADIWCDENGVVYGEDHVKDFVTQSDFVFAEYVMGSIFSDYYNLGTEKKI